MTYVLECVPSWTYVHSLTIEPTNILWVGTRITYQATGAQNVETTVLWTHFILY